MELPDAVRAMIQQAESKSLATISSEYPHVVPVSTVKVIDNKILLVNYFLGTTLKNIQANPRVSLACWKGLEGYQIKATVEYVTEGDYVTMIKEWVAEILPTRTVKGVLILTPVEIYDVTATAVLPGARIA